jgi:UDP-N-acetylmuramoyl-tripeptide--D-alanyl-D-alanine ligase
MMFTWRELKNITGGQWSGGSFPDGIPGVSGVTDDSREVKAGDLFIAIEGGITNGHDHIPEAVQAGAVAICVEQRREDAKFNGTPRLLVDDTLVAFHELACAHRRRFPELDMVGITGSTGKTSVRCMISSILEQERFGHVLSTLGNTNNHFGVPRNLLALEERHHYAVLEIGSNHPGEIAQLTRLAQPRVGLITNIGRAHLEYFGDLLGVAMEKGSLFAGLKGRDAVSVMPYDCAHADILRSIAARHRILTFGENENADVRFEYCGRCEDEYCLRLLWAGAPKGGVELKWAIGGEHQARNAAAACAVAYALGINGEKIVLGLRNVQLPQMRMEVITRNKVGWVNDAYNANPESMRGSVEWFLELTDDYPDSATFLVLGDMLELGDHEEAEHESLLRWVLERFPAQSILPTGPRMVRASGVLGIPAFENAAAVRDELLPRLRAGDWVLLKGSRGMRLETVMP